MCPYDHPVADRYGFDVLADNPHRKPRSTECPVEIGMVVEDAQTGYVGAVVRVEYGRIDLEDRHGKTRGFPLGPGYLLRRFWDDGRKGYFASIDSRATWMASRSTASSPIWLASSSTSRALSALLSDSLRSLCASMTAA